MFNKVYHWVYEILQGKTQSEWNCLAAEANNRFLMAWSDRQWITHIAQLIVKTRVISNVLITEKLKVNLQKKHRIENWKDKKEECQGRQWDSINRHYLVANVDVIQLHWNNVMIIYKKHNCMLLWCWLQQSTLC